MVELAVEEVAMVIIISQVKQSIFDVNNHKELIKRRVFC